MQTDPNGHDPAPGAGADPRRRYAVGDFILDTARRELTGPASAEPFRLAPKTQQVLLALMERPGDVLTRDELLRKVWSGTLPTDYVLGQAITQLRKAFGDVRGHATYIETISKSGYRLCVEVMALDDAPPAHAITVPRDVQSAPGSADVRAPAGRTARLQAKGLMLLAGAVLTAGVIAGLVYSRVDDLEENGPGRESFVIERITAQLGDEIDPALSPDGAFVAYAMRADTSGDFAIQLQAAAATSPSQLTAPPAGSNDRRPRWSADGRKLLFLRISAGGCTIMQVPASGGSAVSMGDCGGAERAGFDWGVDGNSVVAGAAKEGIEGGLRLLDVRSGQWRELPYQAAAGTSDYNPHVSPDGKWIAFQRGVSESSLWRVPIAGGVPQLVVRAPGNIQAWAWRAGSRSVVLSYLGARTGVMQVEVDSGRQRDVPLPDVIHVDAARFAARLVFSSRSGRMGINRYRLTPRGPVGDPEPVFASSGSDMQGSPSPDGAHLAFYSDRTQTTRLWLANMGDPRSLRAVEGLLPMTRHPPAWSPDGRSVWVIGKPQQAETAASNLIYQVDVASGRMTAIPLGQAAPVQVVALPAAQLLAVVDPGDGRLELRHVDLSRMPYRTVNRRASVADIRVDSAGGAIYFARTDRPGVYRTDLQFAGETVIDPAVPAHYWHRQWMLTPAGVQGVVRTAACANQWSAPRSQPAVDPRCLDAAPSQGSMVQGVPATDRAGNWLYLTQTLPTTGVDIGMTTLPDIR